jgi:electron-transferring-flavoprotein dehydrogenase
VKPSEYPPPFDPAEVFTAPTDPADERIDVGILIVGGGPAGLAAAIRAGQLLEERPELAERLGDVPICVVEKGKSPGAHALSGAVVNPRGMQLLFPGMRAAEMPFAGLVEHEAVYYLTEKRALRIPMPPPMRNDRNYFASVSRLSRWLAERAEELGVTIVSETSAVQLLESGGRVVGVRTGDRGRGRQGEPLPGTVPGSDVSARVTILAEGTLGHLSRSAVQRFDLGGAPQVYALGVKEVWEVEEPLVPIIHTIGWPLRLGRRWREFGGSFIYPMGDNLVSLGLVVGLDYADPALSVHDLLQQLKTHPLVRKILSGGKRVAWGAKTIPEGGLQAIPRSLSFPGGMIVGDAAGLVNVPALKGIHYAIESGRLAAETAVAAVLPGATAWAPGGLAGYDEAVRSSFIWSDLRRQRNLRPAFARGFVAGSAIAGMATMSFGNVPRGDLPIHPDAEAPLLPPSARAYPHPDGSLTFDKLSSVYDSGNRTRDDAPDHIRIRRDVPRRLAETWVNMCPAQVYAIAGESAGDGDLVSVEVTASNCVQCGAITAKGGRLTIPEGGDGPEYTIM